MSEASPTVTVIVPTYNSSVTLRLALQTVLWQEWRDYEVWVVGDGCSDDSEAVAASLADPRLHWINLPTNSGGPAVPRNEALRRARGRYVAYLGHDDLWFPDHLRGLVECIEREGADFAYSLGAGITPGGLSSTITVRQNPRCWDTPLSPSNWLHRRDLVQRVGAWSTHVRLGDDSEFLSRVLAAQAHLAYWPRLTMLKFAAGAWRMYALSEGAPQAHYVEAIRRDADRLRLDLLTQAGTRLSQTALRRSHSGLPAPLRTLVRWACDIYGRERWPLNELLYRQWRGRAGLGRTKGSPPGNSQGTATGSD